MNERERRRERFEVKKYCVDERIERKWGGEKEGGKERERKRGGKEGEPERCKEKVLVYKKEGCCKPVARRIKTNTENWQNGMWMRMGKACCYKLLKL